MTRRAAPGGVAYSCDCYRTIKGERYIAWLSAPSDDRIKAYRDAGIRCRRFGEELFVRELDKTSAEQLDFKLDSLRATYPEGKE